MQVGKDFVHNLVMGDSLPSGSAVDPDISSAVAEALKAILGFEALLAESTKRLSDANNREENKSGEETRNKNTDDSNEGDKGE